jgi:predicted DNA binding protein
MVQMQVEEDNGIISYSVDLSQQTPDEELIVLTKDMMSGIEDHETASVHRLYPTVAGQEINLEIILEKNSDVTLSIYDILGNRVKQVEFNSAAAGINHFTFEVGNFGNGQYLYSIIANDKLIRGKFQVQH